MARAELEQPFCHLLGRSHSHIGDQTALQGMRVVEVDHVLRKVGAVVRDQVEMRSVGRGVVFLNQSCILGGRGLDFETVGRAIVGRTHEFIPVSTGSLSVLQIGDEGFQILATIAVAEKGDQLGVGEQWHIFWPLDCVQIRDEGNSDPIVSGDAVVTTQDDA